MSIELFTDEDLIAEEKQKAEKTARANPNERHIDLSSPRQEVSDEPFIDASKVHPEILQDLLDKFHLTVDDLPYLHSLEDVMELSQIRYRKMHPEIFEKPFTEREARANYRLHL